MIIETIQITSFGSLQNVSLSLTGGITLLAGDNESGKSTVASFLSFLFYGFADKNETKRYTSLTTGTAGGSAVLSCEGVRYRVERFLNGKSRECHIIEVETGNEVFPGQVPGEVFFGVPAEVFRNTAYVCQPDSGRINGREVSEAADNLLFSADESVNLPRALKKLDEARAELLYKNQKGGQIYELEQELAETERAASEAKSRSKEIRQLEGTLIDDRARQAQQKERLAECQTLQSRYEETVRFRRQKQLASIQKQLALRVAKCREVEALYTRDGFLPDEAYLEELRTCQRELARCRRLSEEKRDELSKEEERLLSAEKEEEKRLARVAEAAGEENRQTLSDERIQELGKTVLGLRRRRRLMIALSIVFAVCFLFAAVGAVLLMMVSTFYGSLTAAAALLMMGGLLFCLVTASRLAEEQYEKMEAVGAEDTKQFRAILSGKEPPDPDRFSDIPKDFEVLDLPDLPEDEELFFESEPEPAMDPEPVPASEATDADRIRSALIRLTQEQEEWAERLAAACRRFDPEGEPEEVTSEVEDVMKVLAFCRGEVEKYRASCENAKQLLGSDGEQTPTAEPEPLPEDFDPEKNARETDFLTKAIASLEERVHETELRLSTLRAKGDSYVSLNEQITNCQIRLHNLRVRHEAYVTAYDVLTSAGETLRTTLSPRLSETSGKLLATLTDGKYTSLGVDTDFSLSFTPDLGNGSELRRGSEYMSTGTADLAYLSLRLSLLPVLYSKTEPPLVFDESFARLDDTRLTRFLTLLAKLSTEDDRQILIFSSNDREARLLADIPFERIHLPL